MTNTLAHPRARTPGRPWSWLAVAFLLVASGCTQSGTGTSSSGLPESASDPRAAALLIQPAELAGALGAAGEKPVMLHVGFHALYRGGAIPGSRYAGPGSTPNGLASLKDAVQSLALDRPIVIYCGCCPWGHCPNMRPAFKTLRDLGYTNVRALYMPNDLEKDWAGRGYPLEKPTD